MKFLYIIPVIAIATLVLFFIYSRQKPVTTNINIKGQSFSLEIAKTIIQRSVGLSKRSSLCPNCGMIFVFETDGLYPFWMKDTLISLDMVWINSNHEVVSILTATPEPNILDSQLKQYQNSIPARYVIELNSGTAEKINLKIGDKIDIPSNL